MNKQSKTFFSLFALVLLVSASACADSTSDGAATSPTGDPQPITFPVQDPTNNVMQALLEGTLIERERCLYISGEETYTSVLPIWPHGFSYERAGGNVSVLNADGKSVARTDSFVSMGGGMFGEKDAPLPSELRPRVGSCDGPYWIVGEISES